MEAYLAKRPNLKESTKNNHKRKYNDLLKHLQETEDIDYINVELLNTDKYINLIKEFINRKNLPSRTAYINTLLLMISPIKAQPEPSLIETYDIWKDYYYELDALYRNNQVKQIKSESQKEKWVSWEVILKFRKNLNKKFRKNKINTKLKTKYKQNINDINKKEKIIKLIQNNFFEYQYYLMLCMHSYIYPVRTEYSEMIICSWKYYKGLTKYETDHNHYLINDKRKTKTIIFGKDGRKNKMKNNLVIEVPKELCIIINTFIDMRNVLFNFTIKDNDTIPLFYKNNNFKNGVETLENNITPNLYSKNFINFMNRNLKKKVGVSLMRNIFTSYYRRGEKSIEEKKEISEIMNHSPHTQELYYLKQD